MSASFCLACRRPPYTSWPPLIHRGPHLLDRYGREFSTGDGKTESMRWNWYYFPPMAERKRLLRRAGFVLPPTSIILGHVRTRSKMTDDEKAIVKRYAPHLLHYVEEGEDAFELHAFGDRQVHALDTYGFEDGHRPAYTYGLDLNETTTDSDRTAGQRSWATGITYTELATWLGVRRNDPPVV
jgi:hypothetical protein